MATEAEQKGLRIEEFVAEFLGAWTESSVAYEPREDSFLMLEALAELNLRGSKVLDMGTGSGILAAYCARRGAEVTASDVDIAAIQRLARVADMLGVRVKLIACDLFSKIADQFDIIMFNPPYLPSHAMHDRTVDGGKQGRSIINRFLNQVSRHLVQDGFAVLLVSSLNHPERLRERYAHLSFKTLRQRSSFFERLYVLQVRRSIG
jgi:release factor glutamine methyltransferase